MISQDEYLEKLEGFIVRRTEYVKQTNQRSMLEHRFREAAKYYPAVKNKKS